MATAIGVGVSPFLQKPGGGWADAIIALEVDYPATQLTFKFKLPSTKTVTLYWGNGESEAVIGQDAVEITKISLYTEPGLFKFWVGGDVTDLTHIDINSQDFVSGNIDRWAELTNLTFLSAWGTGVDITDVAVLAVLTSLTTLQLSMIAATGDASALSTLTLATTIWLQITDVSFSGTDAWTNDSADIYFDNCGFTSDEVDNLIEALSTCTDCTIDISGTNAHRTGDSNDDLNTLIANGNSITLNDVLGDELYTRLNAANDNVTEAITAFADYSAAIARATQVTQGQDISKMLPLGAELLAHPALDADDWSKDAGWSYDAGDDEYDCDGTNDADLYITEDNPDGKYYLLTVTTNSYSSGSLKARYGESDWFALSFDADETLSVVIRKEITSDVLEVRSVSYSGSISDISLKEIEVLGDDFVTDGDFSDITKAAAKGVAGITKANPGVVTFDADHGYANGDVIYFSGLTEMTELNTEYWRLRNNAGDTFELETVAGSSLDTSGYGAAEATGGDCAQKCDFTEWGEGDGMTPGVDGVGALSGKLSFVDSPSGESTDQDMGLCIDGSEFYIVKYTISGYAEGGVKIRHLYPAASVYGPTRTADGTYNEVCTHGLTSRFYFYTSGETTLDIDNVSVHKLIVTKEIAASTNYTGTHYVLPEEGEDIDSFIIRYPYVAESIVAQKITGETNATTGWSEYNNAVLSVEETNVNEGSFALEIEGNTTPTNGNGGYFALSLTNDNIYRLEMYARHIGSGGNIAIAMGSAPGDAAPQIGALASTDTSFEKLTYYWTYSGTYDHIVVREISGTNDGGVYIDSISIKQVTFP